MKKVMNVTGRDKVICLGSEIVYGQRAEWCDATWRQLRLSLMRSRQCFSYDEREVLPVIVFFCGGGFTTVDHNVWMPELVWFAKRGFAVASVEYSVTARTRFPMQLEDAKLAIRYLRAHAKEYGIDPERMVVMGESAGGFLATFTALSGKNREYDVGDYTDQDSSVKGAVVFYSGANTAFDPNGPNADVLPPDIGRYPKLVDMIDKDTAPPFMLLHGTADSQALFPRSEVLYDALTEKGVPADFYIFEGAEHADAPFFQDETKEVILEFIRNAIQ